MYGGWHTGNVGERGESVVTFFVYTVNPDFSCTLQQHITDTQRYLHDSSGYYSTADLTDYVNEGRWKVVEDTGCNRVLQTITTVANRETYNFSTDLPYKAATINVLNVTLIWGNLRQQLRYFVWTALNQTSRGIVSWQDRPCWWSQFGQQTLYLNPVSDQPYVIELDTVVLPPKLVNLTDVDQLLFPYLRAVPFYAAYKAKLNSLQQREAEEFHQQYIRTIKEIQYATMTRRLGR
jgi:hypothetical protein